MPNPYAHLCGWLGRDTTQQTIRAQFHNLREAAPQLFQGTPTSPILLYEAWLGVLGHFPEYVAQQIGDCVGQAHAHANDLLQCVQIGLDEPWHFRETDT